MREITFTSMQLVDLKLTNVGTMAHMVAESIVRDVHEIIETAKDDELIEELGHPLSDTVLALLRTPVVQRGFAGLLCSTAFYLLTVAGMGAENIIRYIIAFVAQQFSSDFKFEESCHVLLSSVAQNEDLYDMTVEQMFLGEAASRFLNDTCSDSMALEDFAQLLGHVLTATPTLMRLELGIDEKQEEK